MAKILKSSGEIVKKPRRAEKKVAAFERPDLNQMHAMDAEMAGEESPQARAERLFQEAYEAGFQQGASAGLEQFLGDVGESHRALTSAGDAIQQAQLQFLEALEPQVVALAKAVASRILRREMTTDPALVQRTVRAALENLTERHHAVLHLCPQDIEALTTHGISLEDEFRQFERVEIVADEHVPRGGCTIETQSVDVDARLDTQLQRIFDALEE